MKTNIITINTIMNNIINRANMAKKKYMKYICAVLLLIGTSAHAWATASIAEGRYELVTDLSTLTAGDKLIIAGTADNKLYAAKPFANSSATKLTVYNLGDWNTTNPTSYYDIDDDMGICEFTLGGSSGQWTFNDGNYTVYLNGNGDLITSSSSTCSAWEISMASNSRLTFKSQKCGNSSWTKIYMHYNGSGTGQFRAYTNTGTMYLFKYVPSVTLHEGVGGATTSTIAIGDYFPNEAAEVPGWAFIGYWATSADKDCEPDYPSYSTYNSGDPAAAGTYYAIYQGNAYGCNYGIYSCKPTAIYVLSQTNPSSGVGVNLVVPDVGCGEAGTTITLTLVINEPGTSYQGATIVRDDNGQAVSFTYDDSGADPIITFDLPASDVTATVNFECPDLKDKNLVTINEITPVYNTSTGQWSAPVSWNAVDGATQYVYAVKVLSTSETFVPQTVTTSTNVTINNPVVGTEYSIHVVANNPCTSGNTTAEAYKHFTAECAELEGTLAIALDEVGSTTANLSWSGATTPAIQTTAGANSSLKYDVQITRILPLPAESTGGTLDASDVTYTSWEGTGLTTGATYQIDVTAKNACGETMAASRTFKCKAYEDYLFTCADLSLTDEDGTHAPIWITSTAGKMVRSQKALHVEGTGLKPNGAITFTIGGVAANNCASGDVFAIRQANGSAVAADASGDIDMDVYVFYQPSVATDGLDLNAVGTAIVATSAEGTVPPAVREYKAMSATLANVAINGRHLPSQFVVAGKKNNKWYAMPANMASTTNPKPSEIAVDDINNPSIAYTATSNIYTMEGPTASNISGGKGDYIRFVMMPLWVDDADHSKGHAPLFGNSTGSNDIGKSGNSQATSDLASGGWWWKLVQTNTSVTNPQDTKYTIYNHNNTRSLSLRDNSGNPDWGLFASGVEELRLIQASDIPFTEAYFVEWGQHGGVIEVDAQGVDATSVTAHLGANSATATLSQTQTSGKGRASIYNYTVNFGGSIDFAAAASNGAMLTLEWKNGATVKAMSNIVIPKIVASNITINKTNYPLKSDWNTEVHVLPGKTVTIDADYSPNPDVTIKELNIYPGATVVASTGTLIATTLVLRNGWSRAGTKKYDVARLHVTSSTATLKATNVYADWYIDYDQYYPIAVPWNATVANFDYRYCTVEPSVGPSGNIRMRYYDGNSRAINVQEGVGSGANWKQYGEGGNLPVPATLTPSTGYAMTAKRPTGKAFSIIRMPLTLPSGTWGEGSWTTSGEAGNISTTHKDQVAVIAHNSGSTPGYAQGWNFIANPYMSLYQGAITLTPEVGDAITINVVNIPDVDFKEYGQYATATTKLKPASGFLIQTPQDGTITFGTANRKASAPSYRKEVQTETRPEQQVYIVLNDEKAEDMMGLFVSEQYTAEYDLNGDVEKLLSDGNTLRTYMRYGDMNMAYVAINETLAKEWIPVNVRIPEAGEYTYSMHEASIAGELEGVYLIDYQNGDKITNLIEQSYTFSSTAGTINGRFAINAKVGERQTPTGVDIVNGGGDLDSEAPFKFLYQDKVYIYHRGVIYDATGKKVREINK